MQCMYWLSFVLERQLGDSRCLHKSLVSTFFPSVVVCYQLSLSMVYKGFFSTSGCWLLEVSQEIAPLRPFASLVLLAQHSF